MSVDTGYTQHLQPHVSDELHKFMQAPRLCGSNLKYRSLNYPGVFFFPRYWKIPQISTVFTHWFVNCILSRKNTSAPYQKVKDRVFYLGSSTPTKTIFLPQSSNSVHIYTQLLFLFKFVSTEMRLRKCQFLLPVVLIYSLAHIYSHCA